MKNWLFFLIGLWSCLISAWRQFTKPKWLYDTLRSATFSSKLGTIQDFMNRQFYWCEWRRAPLITAIHIYQCGHWWVSFSGAKFGWSCVFKMPSLWNPDRCRKLGNKNRSDMRKFRWQKTLFLQRKLPTTLFRRPPNCLLLDGNRYFQ